MDKHDQLVLDSICMEDPFVFALTHIDLLDAKKWSINDRKWVIEPFMALNPHEIERSPTDTPRKMAIRKSTQAGISTLSISKALHFMSYWDVRVGYMLPRQQDISVFSMTRLDPIIRNSPFLMSKLRQPDSTYIKTLGNSYMYFLEGSVEPRSIPIDMLLLDEVDLSNPDHVGTAINRLDASNWKTTIWLSTPTLPATGIDAVYESSDKRQWLVPCPHCGEYQPMDWELNVRITGPAAEPTDVQYICVKCKKVITLQDIQEGQWVPERPSRSSEMIGYHISQMMTTPAADLYVHFRDPNQSIAEFYRKRLGIPYTMAGGSIEREDFLVSCFTDPFTFDDSYDGESTYYMGVDQGNQLQVLVGKIEKGRRRPKIVHIELIPFETGFERVAQLINLYRVRRCIVDGDPNRHPVKDLQKKFPGRVMMADYIEQRERFVKKLNEKRIPVHVTINRTEGFDDLVKSIKDGLWLLPGDGTRLPGEVETLIDHVTAIKRDIEKRKTQSGEIEVGVWRKLRADHLAHSWVYLKTAMDMDASADFKMAVINSKRMPTKQVMPEVEGVPNQDNIVAITAAIAEVPVAQLKEFLQRNEDPEYTAPFPLRAKLNRIAQYQKSDVEWVMNFLIRGAVGI